MRAVRLFTTPFLALCLLALVDCTGRATVATAAAPALQPGRARVWVLRQTDPVVGYVQAAAPMVFADGAPIGRSRAGTAFYRDFAPGTYRFTVESYGGLPTGQAETVRLAAGSETYLQVQWLASWQVGYPEAGWSFAPNTFAILTMSAQLAQAYLPTLSPVAAP
ncbi:MAG TPA: DUF2846 domain-containing protein [Stellaceae bacterium]|nr:DUF2846 domain-containing protein [Stellaceae bacterium]